MDERDRTILSGTERIALAIVASVLILVTIVVVGRVGSPDGSRVGPPEARPTLDPDVTLPISVLDALVAATVWVERWNEDAELLLVNSQFERSVDDAVDDDMTATPAADAGLIVFSFVAPKEGDEWPRASVAISRETGLIFHDETLSSSAAPPEPVDIAELTTLPIAAEQAFWIAEQIVGQSYRDGCEPSRRQVSVNLDATDQENLTWVVVYYDQRVRQRNDIVVRIHAGTGDVETDVRGDVACDVP